MIKKYILFLSFCVSTAKAASAQSPVPGASRHGRQIIGVAGVVGMSGKGFGLHYEHLLNKKRTVSCFFQTSFCWSRARQANMFYNGAYIQGHDRYPFMMSLQPGVRFYPKGNAGNVTYALDASLLYGFGKGDGGGFEKNTPIFIDRKYWGVLFGNSLNVKAGQRVRITLGGNLGVGEDNGVTAAYLPFTDVALFGQAFIAVGYQY